MRVNTRARSPRNSGQRSEEHTSELQSRLHLVCRLLLEKKKKTKNTSNVQNLITQITLCFIHLFDHYTLWDLLRCGMITIVVTYTHHNCDHLLDQPPYIF